MSEVAPQTEDKATPAPQPDAPIAEIEIVDTPVAPEVTPQAQPAPAPLIAGKFRTPEEAAKAYEEAQRMMHEKAQEAATYRKMLEVQAARPQPAYQAPSVDIGEKFPSRILRDGRRTVEISGTALLNGDTQARAYTNRTKQRLIIVSQQATTIMGSLLSFQMDIPQMQYTEFPPNILDRLWLKLDSAQKESWILPAIIRSNIL